MTSHVIGVNLGLPRSRYNSFFLMVTTTPVLQITHYEYCLALALHAGGVSVWQGLSQIMQQGLRILDCLPAARCYPPAFDRFVVYPCTGLSQPSSKAAWHINQIWLTCLFFLKHVTILCRVIPVKYPPVL